MRLQNLRDLTPSKPPTSTEGVPLRKTDSLPLKEGLGKDVKPQAQHITLKLPTETAN